MVQAKNTNAAKKKQKTCLASEEIGSSKKKTLGSSKLNHRLKLFSALKPFSCGGNFFLVALAAFPQAEWSFSTAGWSLFSPGWKLILPYRLDAGSSKKQNSARREKRMYQLTMLIVAKLETVVAKLKLWFYSNKHGSKNLSWFQQKTVNGGSKLVPASSSKRDTW